MSIDVRDRLVDAHIHVHSADTSTYPLAAGYGSSDLWSRSMTPEDHARSGRRYGRVRANLVQPTWYGLDHRYIADCIAAGDRYAGTGVVPALADVRLPEPGRTMAALSERGIRAFRIRGRSAGGGAEGARWLDHPGYDAMFATAAAHGLALSFLAGPLDLPEIGRMCDRFPETRVLIDHLGGVRGADGRVPGEHVAALCDLARRKSVMVKLGPFHAWRRDGAGYGGLPALLRRVIESFGPDRCMWETDMGGPIPMARPEEEFAASLEMILESGDFLSTEDMEHILFRTAESVFFP